MGSGDEGEDKQGDHPPDQDTILSVTAGGIVNATDPNLSSRPEFAARAGIEVVHECIVIGWCDVGAAVIQALAICLPKRSSTQWPALG